MKKKRYSKKFKEEAVKRVIEQNQSRAQVARELGIADGTIRSWVRIYQEDTGQPFVGSGNLRDKDDELRKLKKEVKDLKEQNEILKKATAIFAKDLGSKDTNS
jgi:transposase